MLSLLLCADLMIAMAQYGTILYNIPAAGQTVTLSPFLLSNTFITLGTNGATNLGANSYTMTYSGLPSAGSTWEVKMDFRRLTISTNGSNVTVFGVKPLLAHPTVDTFDITFIVIPDSVGTKYLYYRYNGLSDWGVVNGTMTFNGRVNFNDSVFLYGLDTYLKPVSTITTGQTVIVTDTAGKLGFGCAPWCITGNSALSPSANFLGTTDTGSLRFRVNNVASGIIDYNAGSTAFGYSALKANTSGTGNTAIGGYSLLVNTTGFSNTAIGGTSLAANTTGQYNTGCGEASLTANTTGINNSGFGISSLLTNTTGSYNTAIGGLARCAAASSNYAIALGYNAIASSNQLAIAGIRSISIPQMTSALNYVLTDTSGSGDFVPRVIPAFGQTTFTPITGDSLTITTSQNDINPAGTLAVLTIILPASPVSGFVYEFSTTQVLTSLLWSVRLSGGTTTGLPSTLAQYGTVKIKWNSALSRWLNY